MEFKNAVEGFAALAQEKRLELVRLLAAAGSSGMSAGAIAGQLRMPPSSLSHHLAALEGAGLVRSTRQGRHLIYAVRFAGLRELLMVLTETCCAGQPGRSADIARLLPEDQNREDHMTAAFNVLFICTRNSARSIMAEAILQRVGGGKFNAYSAGSDPASAPMPEVLDRLQRMGHDISGLRSKSWHDFTGSNAPRMDFVITLCDPAEGETCPDLGEKPVTAIWPFPDPAKFTGSATERTALLNELYGMIRRRIDAFSNLPLASLDKTALKARLDEIGDSALSWR